MTVLVQQVKVVQVQAGLMQDWLLDTGTFDIQQGHSSHSFYHKFIFRSRLMLMLLTASTLQNFPNQCHFNVHNPKSWALLNL